MADLEAKAGPLAIPDGYGTLTHEQKLWIYDEYWVWCNVRQRPNWTERMLLASGPVDYLRAAIDEAYKCIAENRRNLVVHVEECAACDDMFADSVQPAKAKSGRAPPKAAAASKESDIIVCMGRI